MKKSLNSTYFFVYKFQRPVSSQIMLTNHYVLNFFMSFPQINQAAEKTWYFYFSVKHWSKCKLAKPNFLTFAGEQTNLYFTKKVYTLQKEEVCAQWNVSAKNFKICYISCMLWGLISNKIALNREKTIGPDHLESKMPIILGKKI